MIAKKICFVGLYNEHNMGDPVIAHCSEWLITGNNKNCEISHVTLDVPDKILRFSFLYRIEAKIRKILKGNYTQEQFSRKVYSYAVRYFLQQVKENDIVVLVGGGLIKYKYQFLGVETAALCKACDIANIPLIINAVGIEGYDEDNAICRMIEKSLCLPSLKYISTRDDLDTLKNGYLKHSVSVKCEKVADPAVWASEAYNIKKNTASKCIGVGIARAGLFKANDINISGEHIFSLYRLIVLELTKRGYEVQLFTNGLLSDNRMAEKLRDSLLVDGFEFSLNVPRNDEELVKILSNYKGIVATRLHSCIISYSLDIPAIGLVWNDKLTFFGNNIGRPENFIKHSNFEVNYIVDQLERAMKYGYNHEIKNQYRATIKNSTSQLNKEYLQNE